MVRSLLAKAGLSLAILGVLVLLAAGPGTRLGLWGWRAGLSGLMGGFGLSVVAFLVCVAAFWRAGGEEMGRTRALCLAGLLISGGAAIVPYGFKLRAGNVPAIHDITTDTQDPPQFAAIVARREGAPNSLAYGGAEVALAQQRAYPDIAPALVRRPPAEALARARQVVNELGWELVAVDEPAGRIEATDTTFWFGFKDDVVIRIRKTPEGSRVDVRSVSRVGRSDVGANAARIRRFMDRFAPPPE